MSLLKFQYEDRMQKTKKSKDKRKGDQNSETIEKKISKCFSAKLWVKDYNLVVQGKIRDEKNQKLMRNETKIIFNGFEH